ICPSAEPRRRVMATGKPARRCWIFLPNGNLSTSITAESFNAHRSIWLKVWAKGRDQRSEVRDQKSEVRSQKSEVRGQKSEVRSQRSEIRELLRDLCN